MKQDCISTELMYDVVKKLHKNGTMCNTNCCFYPNECQILPFIYGVHTLIDKIDPCIYTYTSNFRWTDYKNIFNMSNPLLRILSEESINKLRMEYKSRNSIINEGKHMLRIQDMFNYS